MYTVCCLRCNDMNTCIYIYKYSCLYVYLYNHPGVDRIMEFFSIPLKETEAILFAPVW